MKYGVISLVLCISTHLRLVTILSLLVKYLVIFHADLCNWASEVSPTLGCSIEISRDIYIYYIGALNGPIKLVRRGGIYFYVPPQCSIPDTVHDEWVRRYGYSSSLVENILCNKLNIQNPSL